MPEQYTSGSVDELRSHLENLPAPSLLTSLRWRVEHLEPARLRLSIETAIARVRRGWAPRDTWSLDGHLCRTLGAMLDHLAEHTHGWPQGRDFPEFADRQKALRTNATALLAYEADDEENIAPAKPLCTGSPTTCRLFGTEPVRARRHI